MALVLQDAQIVGLACRRLTLESLSALRVEPELLAVDLRVLLLGHLDLLPQATQLTLHALGLLGINSHAAVAIPVRLPALEAPLGRLTQIVQPLVVLVEDLGELPQDSVLGRVATLTPVLVHPEEFLL